MGLFDFFKNKDTQANVDSFEYKLMNMDKGSVFDYDLKSWVVVQVNLYRWQDGSESVEYLVDSGDAQWFMSVDAGDDMGISLTQRVKVRVIDPGIPNHILENEEPPSNILYEGIEFVLDGEAVGMYQEGKDEWSDLISWDYYDKDDKKILTIEQWGERDFDAAYGLVIDPHQITNILPSPNS